VIRGLSRVAAVLALVLLEACATPAPPPTLLTLEPARFADLAGWGDDHQAAALAAFVRSCAELGKRAEWGAVCAAAAAVPPGDAAARGFFESNFTPYLAGNNADHDGLFTGYYEPLLTGARKPGAPYTTPILKRPPDLVMVDLGRFRPAWHGERIAGRVENGSLIPYPSRAEIEAGALDLRRLALLWVDDPVAAFFLQVQGSGRVKLPDGSTVRLGYDGQNGQPYVAIGKLLVARGELTADAVSLQSIRAWIAAHPTEGAALMDQNPSYVFFRELPGDGPVGSEGVVLTPGRSLAVDRSYVPLGVPVFIDVTDSGGPLRRLMVAQDTGGAIAGPVRGDVFWGFGPEAEARAGTMRARGRDYLLLPKTLQPPRLVSMLMPAGF
jgi:membrane-bound lytic murein transglycosylase A